MDQNPVPVIMKKSVVMVLLGLLLVAPHALAQQKTVTGKVTSELGAPLSGVSVILKGTNTRTATNNEGSYSVRAAVGQVLQFRLIGTALVERTVGDADVIDVPLRRVALDLDAVVVTALGEATERRALGTAQQTIRGADIAQTQRENFVNALQGRIAGVDVTSTSGVPGASASIIVRGITSISGSNQPLMIVDGLPMDNRTLNTGLLASDANSNTALSNRAFDCTHRAAVSRRHAVLRQPRRLPPQGDRRHDQPVVQRGHGGQPHQLPAGDGRRQAKRRRPQFGVRPPQRDGGVPGPDRSLAEQRRLDEL